MSLVERRTLILCLLILAATQAVSAGQLKVLTEPSGVDVYLEMLKLGTTTDAGLLLDLPAGEVTLLIEKPGFVSVRRTVTIDGGPAVLRVRLTPLQPQAGPPAAGERSTRPETRRRAGDRPLRRFSLLLGGAFAAAREEFSGTRGFTEFAEEGRLDTAYSSGAGAAFEGGLQYLFASHVGVALSFGLASPRSDAHFEAVFPHPFFFDRDRLAAGDVGLSRTDTAVFLDLVYAGSSGRFGWRLFGGPAWMRVSTDLVESVQYTHSYPYDEVAVRGQSLRSLSDGRVGFGVGTGVDYEVARHLALGAQVRFSRATATLAPAGQDAMEVTVGGLQAGVLVRVPF